MFRSGFWKNSKASKAKVSHARTVGEQVFVNQKSAICWAKFCNAGTHFQRLPAMRVRSTAKEYLHITNQEGVENNTSDSLFCEKVMLNALKKLSP